MDQPHEFDRLRLHGWNIEHHSELRDGVWAFEREHIDTTFRDDVQDAMAVAAEASWWYRTRNTLLCDLLDSVGVEGPLWEIGAGTGMVSIALQQHGIDVVAVEPSESGIRAAHHRGVALSLQATLEQLRLPDHSIRSIGLFDVLEHLDQPHRTLTERRVLTEDGHLVVTVPAMQWLWSDADSLAGHRCRYSRRVLRRELEAADYRVEHMSYRFSSMVLPVAVGRSLKFRLGMRTRMADVYKQVGNDAGRLGTIATNVERRLGGAIPFGTSIFAVARPSG